MEEKQADTLKEFAKKIAIVAYTQAIKKYSLKEKSSSPFKGFHLPFKSIHRLLANLSKEDLNDSLSSVNQLKGDIKISFQVSTDFLFEKRIESSTFEELFEVALHAYQCLDQQDLHLFSLKRLLLENGLSLRQVKNWKFPCSDVANKEISRISDHLAAFYEQIQKKHKINQIQ